MKRLSRKLSLSRKFDGKVYDFIGTHKTKKVAEESKEYLKERNFLVRIVKLATGYAIYTRDRR